LGQKTHPFGFRLGIIKTWRSRWYSEKEYAPQLQEDLRIRGFVKGRLNHAGVSSVEIERRSNRINVLISTARPGIVIGKKGAEIENLKKEIQKLTRGNDQHPRIAVPRRTAVIARTWRCGWAPRGVPAR
jgi:small subunit ribosomal protein S3